jgi:hypothetical protein
MDSQGVVLKGQKNSSFSVHVANNYTAPVQHSRVSKCHSAAKIKAFIDNLQINQYAFEEHNNHTGTQFFKTIKLKHSLTLHSSKTTIIHQFIQKHNYTNNK